MRTFISFNLEDNIKNKITDIQSQIKKKQKPASLEFIKWENKSKFHLTVFFLGEIVNRKTGFSLNRPGSFLGKQFFR